MTLEERKPTGLVSSATELRRLIIENPDLPLVVFAGDEANSGGDYSYVSCSCVRASVGSFLDCCQTINDCKCYTDRDEFEEDVADSLAEWPNGPTNGTDAEWNAYVKSVVAEYDPYWKKCIILYVNN